jgi:meso-butanediol dehydrogenase/(S,S)-butanediol dehydrogenase/diacetyl reductase
MAEPGRNVGKMNGRLMQRAAIITGAARGIGRATAGIFAQEGARLGLLDRDADALADAAKALSADNGHRVSCHAADIADSAAVSHAINALVDQLGGLDILVCNAAARAYGPVAEMTAESWQPILQTNIVGLVNCTRAALPHLRKSGHGSIVVVSSAFALAGRENMGQYDATKAAILALTRVLACEEARYGVRVNAVCPGSTLTPWTMGRAAARGMSVEELKERGAVPSLLARWAEPEEIAWPILWLASSEASFITGVSLPVDGGLTAV